MRNNLVFIALCCLALTSCEGPKKNEPPKSPTAMAAGPDSLRATSETDRDRKVAAAIRQAIAGYPAAQHVVVNVKAGVVQLWGHVPTPTAREEVAMMARKVPGAGKVVNQVEVKRPAY